MFESHPRHRPTDSGQWITNHGQRRYSSRAWLTVLGQGLQFQGRAYGSWARLTVSGHSDVPLSGLGRWMACPALLQKAVLGMPQYPVASQNAYTPAQLLRRRFATQGLQFQGRAYGSMAGLTVPGHSDVPLSGLGRWMACPALLQKAGLGRPQYPVASQNAYNPARLLHSRAATQGLRFQGRVMCRRVA